VPLGSFPCVAKAKPRCARPPSTRPASHAWPSAPKRYGRAAAQAPVQYAAKDEVALSSRARSCRWSAVDNGRGAQAPPESSPSPPLAPYQIANVLHRRAVTASAPRRPNPWLAAFRDARGVTGCPRSGTLSVDRHAKRPRRGGHDGACSPEGARRSEWSARRFCHLKPSYGSMNSPDRSKWE